MKTRRFAISKTFVLPDQIRVSIDFGGEHPGRIFIEEEYAETLSQYQRYDRLELIRHQFGIVFINSKDANWRIQESTNPSVIRYEITCNSPANMIGEALTSIL